MDLQKADIIDYAMPLMRIEALVKETYALCLDGLFEEARLTAQMLCAEGRLLQHTLLIMEEKEKDRNANPKAIQAER